MTNKRTESLYATHLTTSFGQAIKITKRPYFQSSSVKNHNAIMHEYRDASKEISDVDFKSPDTKRRLLAKNEMQNKTLECKLTALKKEHRKSISKIDCVISEVLDKLKKPCLTDDFQEETIIIKGEAAARRNKEDCCSHPQMFPALRPSKFTNVKRTTAYNSAHGLFSNVSLKPKALEKNILKTDLGYSAAKPAENSKRLRYMKQKYQPLQMGSAEHVGHMNARKKAFNMPFILITAPYSKCRKSLRISKSRKSSDRSEVAESKDFEVVANPAENDSSLFENLKLKTVARPELKSLQTSVDELHIPSYHIEEKEHVNKGGFRFNSHERTKSESSGDLEVSSLAEEDISRQADSRKLSIDLWKVYSCESVVDGAS